MSYELAHNSPSGTKWNWGSKALNYSPWVCNLASQKEPNFSLWPLDIVLYVDVYDGVCHWAVHIIDFQHKRYLKSGVAADPLKACLEAESVGEKQLAELLPDWAKEALARGWRPPCQPT
jgi:hypothetical protein